MNDERGADSFLFRVRRSAFIVCSVSPGAGHEARLPVRQKLYCEDSHWSGRPKNHWFQRGCCLYPGGRVVLVSRKSSTQQSSARFGVPPPMRAAFD